MDLFFGAATDASRAQQPAKVRVEERVVKRRSPTKAAVGTGVSSRAHSNSPERDDRKRRRPQQQQQVLQQQQQQQQREQQRLEKRRNEQRPQKRLPTSDSSSISPRNSVIVNSNRERVGSLPPSPRPHKAHVRTERKKPAARPERSARSPVRVAAGSPGQEIERC
ncbi:hypothetical protein IWW55_005471, partial [Coemansia sp. RSA 2706]